MAELKFEITEKIGVLSENAKGWTKELNMVSWNEHEPKYDIREWSPDHSRMGKGVTLTADDLANLKDLLNVVFKLIFKTNKFTFNFLNLSIDFADFVGTHIEFLLKLCSL